MSLLICIMGIFALQTVAQNPGDSASVYFEKGQLAYQEKKFREAEKHYNQSLQFTPDHQASLKGLYEALIAQNRYPEAYAQLKKLEPLTDANDTYMIAELSRLSLNMRRWHDAVQYAQKALSLKMEGDYNFTLAKAYYHLEDYGKAIHYTEMAYKDDSSVAEIFYIAARSFVEMSNYQRAAGCYEQALQRDPEKVNWMYEAGLVYYAVPDDKKAIYWMEKAGEKGYPKSADYIENLANAYLNLGDYKKGTEMLISLLEKRPKDQELLYNIADGFYRHKKYVEAIEYWDRALEIDNKNAQALYMIGLSYQKKGEEAKGKQLCDRAIQMDPSLASLKQERRIR